MSATPDRPIADAVTRNWVDRFAPVAVRPYLRLARFDRPIGTWLLLWPCWWSLMLAGAAADRLWPDPGLMILFAVGALAMRGAGCAFNDIVDRDLDRRVARTADRPIASGLISRAQGFAFLTALSLIGFVVLLSFNGFAIGVGLASLAVVAVYPFAKRFTDWPQLVLGFAFNWGALLGWAAAGWDLAWGPVVLYAAGISWTLGYDTIYAHQDKEDDAAIGVRSTALLFGPATKRWLWAFYGASLAFLLASGLAAGLSIVYAICLVPLGMHFVWQIRTLNIDDAENCLRVFRSNRDAGALGFLAIFLGALLG